MNSDRATPLEAIKAQAERLLPGPISDEEIERIAAVAPAFYALVKARADGALPGGRRLRVEALRRANKQLLDYLAGQALDLFRGARLGLAPLDAALDLCAVASFLRFEESEEEDFDLGAFQERIYEAAREFSYSILIEATRRTVEGIKYVDEKGCRN